MTSAFDLKKALAGHPVGFSDTQPCHRFTYLQSDRYSAVYEGKSYIFNRNGYKISVEAPGDLYMLSDSITEVQDNKDDLVTRSGTDTGSSGNIILSALKPRDYFAQEALNGILKGIANPIELKDYDIKELVALSYKIAQEMLDKSVQMRALYEPESEEVTYDVTSDSEGNVDYKVSATRSSTDGGVSFVDYNESGSRIAVNTCSLATNTEKLLYNIWRSLDAMNVRSAAVMAQAQPLNSKLTAALTSTAEALEKVASNLDGVSVSISNIESSASSTASNTSSMKTDVSSIASGVSSIDSKVSSSTSDTSSEG